MFIGEAHIDGVTSLLFSVDGKITGYKIVNWHRYPLDNKEFDELKKLQLSSNNKVIEDNDYKVILDLDSGYKHYFKDGKEDLEMFYQMNGEDYTLYSGKSNNSHRRKIGKIIFVTFMEFYTVIITIGIVSLDNDYRDGQVLKNIMYPLKCYEKSLNYANLEEAEISLQEMVLQGNEILPLSVDEISNYITSSSRLTDEEKAFLNNKLFFTDMLPYINKSDCLVERLRQELYEIDIQAEEPGKDCSKISGYNNGTNILHVVGYDEEPFKYRKQTVAHEFAHNFHQNRRSFTYLREATNELIACEYFDVPNESYYKPVKIVKCLMEIIGPEPILEYHVSGNAEPLYNALSPYLTKVEISLFTLDKDYIDYTTEEKNSRYEGLKCVLDKLYYGIYGESMWNNAMINAIFNDLEYERYYFNSEKIKNIDPYACAFTYEEEYTIEDAIDEGYIYPFIAETRVVSLEEWLNYGGLRDIGEYTCKVPNEGIITETGCIRIINEDGTVTDMAIEEAVESGIMTINNDGLKITLLNPTDDLDNENIQYIMEENVVMDGDKVIVTKYQKEYFPPIQEKGNMLN